MNAMLLRVLAGVVVIALGAWLYSATEWVDEPLPPTPDEAVRKDRLFAAKALLRALGAQVEERQSLEQLPPADATLVLTSLHWRLFPARVKALRQFVEAGGHLVIPSHLARPRYGDRERDEDDDSDDEDEEDDGRHDMAWLGVAAQPVQREERKTPSEPTEEAPGAASRTPSLKRTGPPCVARSEAPHDAAVFQPPRAITLCTVPTRRFQLVGRTTPAWSLVGPDGAEVMRVPVGRGRVTMTMAADLHDNDDLLTADHALLLAATLDLRRSDTVWFIATEARPSLATLLQRHGLAAVLVGALALLLALWRGGTRFGPRQAVPLPQRRSVREQIAGTAAFIAARGGAPLHQAQLRALERTASQRLPGFDRLVAAPERAEAIAQAAALDPIALAHAMDGARKRPPRALAAALALLETARRRLLLPVPGTTPTPTSNSNPNPPPNPKARR